MGVYQRSGPPVDAGTATQILFGNSVTLSPSGAVTYNWLPATGLSCTNCANPVATPLFTTTYTVTGTDAAGCTNTDTVTVIVDVQCGDVFVPNVFSPNLDGLNDKLFVFGNCIIEMQFDIYDRWGNRVFTSINQNEGWDGMWKGNMLNNGVYAWQLNAVLITGETKKLSGEVQLLQ
jgi:gliding motility-associated-like protein